MTLHQRIAELQARAEQGDEVYPQLDELYADRNEGVYAAALGLSEIVPAFIDNASHFSCHEVEKIANLFRAIGEDDDAAQIVERHAEDDEEGDDHYQKETAS